MAKLRLESEWLKADDVKEGDLITITGEHIERSAEETPFGRPTIEIPVRLPDGREKRWTMNKTTLKRLMGAWGNDTATWINKKVRIRKAKQNIRGVLKDVLYGEPA